MISAFPFFSAFISPLLLTDTILLLLDLNLIFPAGFTFTDILALFPFFRFTTVLLFTLRLGFFTFTSQRFVIPLAFAVIVTLPAFFAVTLPFLTVAIFLSLVFHSIRLLEPVILASISPVVLPFVYSVSFVLLSFNAGFFTVILHVLRIPFAVAVIVTFPAFFAVTLPFFTVAIFVSPDFQLTFLLGPVTFAVSRTDVVPLV